MQNMKAVDYMVLIKKCHVCGALFETHKELKKCLKCKKSFLPCNYFNKVHAKDSNEFEDFITFQPNFGLDLCTKFHNCICFDNHSAHKQ